MEYDANGSLSSESAADGSGKSYFFDGRDQLSAVEMKSAGGALVHRSEFIYDGMGRLMKSSEFTRSGTSWVKQSETNRVFDGLETVQERDVNNALMAQLTRDGNIGGVLSRKAGASTSFFGYDGNGNVTLLSDAQGNSVGHYRYDGFGNALEITGSVAQENEHRFSTKELHAPSGLYYYGFRFYSPALGRWINRDPIREMGGVNLYQMVGNNPVNLVDEYGLSPNGHGKGYWKKGNHSYYGSEWVHEQKKLWQKYDSNPLSMAMNHNLDNDFDYKAKFDQNYNHFWVNNRWLNSAEFGNYAAGYGGTWCSGLVGAPLNHFFGALYEKMEQAYGNTRTDGWHKRPWYNPFDAPRDHSLIDEGSRDANWYFRHLEKRAKDVGIFPDRDNFSKYIG